MDTATHAVMGLALGGLATLDPIVAENSVTHAAVIVGTLVGSQAPDIDTVLKLRNNAVYIRNHRGITHSIPAIFLWPIGITLVISFFFPEANLLHLWIWTFIAVFLHVFVDLFNAYGTQALRPFSSKWIALGVINTFDPIIFAMHLGGIIIWACGGHPGFTFLGIYCLLALYYVVRYRSRQKVLQEVKKLIPDATDIIVSPTLKFREWKIAVMNPQQFFVGKAHRHHVQIIDQFKRVKVPESPVLEAAKKDPNLSAFLSFSPVYRWEINEYDNFYEVRFIDLRYRSKNYYPFVAVVHLDKHLNIITSYTGWIFSEEKLRKKLSVVPNSS